MVHSLRMDVDQRLEKSKWKFNNEIHVVCGALKVGSQDAIIYFLSLDHCFHTILDNICGYEVQELRRPPAFQYATCQHKPLTAGFEYTKAF